MEALNLQTPFLADLADGRLPARGGRHGDLHAPPLRPRGLEHDAGRRRVGADVPERALPALPRRVGALESTKAASGYAATIDDAVRPVIDAGLADLVPSDHRVTDEIRLEATPGHTPGHVAVHVESGGQHALITGDLAHHPVQFAEPDWFADPDTDRAQSEATRRRLLAEHADTDVLVIGTHFAPPCSGHLVADGNGYRFQAVAAEDA